MLGEENEEYHPSWSSDWQTHDPGERGGVYNASAPTQDHHARYGPLASFPFRYLMSSLRALQMRVTYLLASNVVVNPELYSYVALEIGREADDSPDAWCFMASAEFKWGRGTVSNFERWLYQRDEPATTPNGVVTFPDARVTQTPAWPANRTWMTSVHHDWIAHTAPRGVIGFALDKRFVSAPTSPLGAAVVKVTYFDVVMGNISLTQSYMVSAHGGVPPLAPSTLPRRTIGDGRLKTLTFYTSLLATRDDTAATSHPFDFEVRAVAEDGTPQVLVLSMVRVIKDIEIPSPLPPEPPRSPPPPLHPMVTNMGENCWAECGFAQGSCERYCGVQGACCRMEFNDSPWECGFGALGCDGIHCCSPSATPPVTPYPPSPPPMLPSPLPSTPPSPYSPPNAPPPVHPRVPPFLLLPPLSPRPVHPPLLPPPLLSPSWPVSLMPPHPGSPPFRPPPPSPKPPEPSPPPPLPPSPVSPPRLVRSPPLAPPFQSPSFPAFKPSLLSPPVLTALPSPQPPLSPTPPPPLPSSPPSSSIAVSTGSFLRLRMDSATSIAATACVGFAVAAFAVCCIALRCRRKSKRMARSRVAIRHSRSARSPSPAKTSQGGRPNLVRAWDDALSPLPALVRTPDGSPSPSGSTTSSGTSGSRRSPAAAPVYPSSPTIVDSAKPTVGHGMEHASSVYTHSPGPLYVSVPEETGLAHRSMVSPGAGVAIMPTPRGLVQGGPSPAPAPRKTTVYVTAAGVHETTISPTSFQAPRRPVDRASKRLSVLQKMAALSGRDASDSSRQQRRDHATDNAARSGRAVAAEVYASSSPALYTERI